MMRLNRGTIVLLIASLAVIIAVLILNNNQASAPETTATSVAATAVTLGPMFPELAYSDVIGVEVINNQNGEKTFIAKSATGEWSVPDATFITDREVDQPAATTWVTNLTQIQANESFESEALGDFGLVNPAYVLIMTTKDGTTYTLYVGNRNPTGNRYYVVLETEEGTAPPSESTVEATDEAATAEATIETTAEAPVETTAEATLEVFIEETVEPYEGVTLSSTGTIYIMSLNTINDLIALITNPPYVPAPTPLPSVTPTLNPLSEVEQATATAQVGLTLTAFNVFATDMAATATAAVITPLPSIEPTAEATAEAE